MKLIENPIQELSALVKDYLNLNEDNFDDINNYYINLNNLYGGIATFCRLFNIRFIEASTFFFFDKNGNFKIDKNGNVFYQD